MQLKNLWNCALLFESLEIAFEFNEHLGPSLFFKEVGGRGQIRIKILFFIFIFFRNNTKTGLVLFSDDY